jgi:hypothetical protein
MPIDWILVRGREKTPVYGRKQIPGMAVSGHPARSAAGLR